MGLRVAVFDSEEDGLAPDATVVWCIVIKDIHTKERYSYGPDGIHDALTKLQTFDVIIGHNIIQHDLPIFNRLCAWKFHGEVVDTLWMSRIQRPNRMAPPNCPNKQSPHGLEAWGYRLGRYKVEHEDWTQFSDAMLYRCEEDTELNCLVYDELKKEAKGEGWWPAEKQTFKLLTYLQRQEEHGWMADRPHMDRCIAQLDRWIVRIDNATYSRLPLVVEPLEGKKAGEYGYIKKPFLKSGLPAKATVDYWGEHVGMVVGPFSRISFRRVNLNSNEETKTFLLNSGWEPAEYNFNKLGERTSPKLSKDDPFDGIQGSLGRLIALRVKCRHRKSNIEGYVEAIRLDGRISPRHSGFATTGRLKHAVIVNVPSVDSKAFYGKQMRACFIATPGMVLVGADSKGNQNRQLAARMDDEEFTKVVLFGNKKEGTDLHSFNKKLSGVGTITLAKNFFYGLLFGAQDKKIGKVIGKDAAAGKVLREGYLARLPKLAVLIDKLKQEWLSTAKRKWNDKWNKWEYTDGFITGIDGRPILVDTEHKLLNYALQSDEAIQMGFAYVLVHEEMARRGHSLGQDWAMLIWYHDEFQAESRPEIAKELGEIMCWAIKEAGILLGIKCPHDGDYKIGKDWATTH